MAEEPKKIIPAPTVLPGLSYIPDALEIAEDVSIQRKVASEFLDFLNTVTDLLQLIHIIKVKHLRSMTPLPFDVIREVLNTRAKGPRFRVFEKGMGDRCVGITTSVDNFLRSGHSTASSNLSPTVRNIYRKPIAKETHKRRPIDVELQDIIGKKVKPVWHIVAMEKSDPIHSSVSVTHAGAKTSASQSNNKPASQAWEKTPLKAKKPDLSEISRTRSEQLMFSIKFATTAKALPSTDRFKAQVAMMEAYFAGFDSVESHQKYLETLKPHWFTDLLKCAVSTGVVLARDIIAGFEKLGKFYHMTCSSVGLARAKLCFILMSLPMWDITRMKTQQAAEYILSDILLIPQAQKNVRDWLMSRRLPYVVLPPISLGQLAPAPKNLEKQAEQPEDEADQEGEKEHHDDTSRED